MKATPLLIAVATFFFALPLLHAQAQFSFPIIDSPAIVQNGLDKYRTDGSAAALGVWLDGSSLGNSKTAVAALQAEFTKLENKNGKMLRFEQIGTISLSPSVRVGWYTICYANGVGFVEFQAYQGQSSWIITHITVATNYRDILPAYQFPLH